MTSQCWVCQSISSARVDVVHCAKPVEGSACVLSWKAVRLSGYYSVIYMISVQYARHILFRGCQLSKNNFWNSHCQHSSGFPSTLQKHECGSSNSVERDSCAHGKSQAWYTRNMPILAIIFNVAKQEAWLIFAKYCGKLADEFSREGSHS